MSTLKILRAWMELQKAREAVGFPLPKKVDLTFEQTEELLREIDALAKPACTCIQTHASTCQAAPRLPDLAAPFVGMRFQCQPPVIREPYASRVTAVDPDRIDWIHPVGSETYLLRADWDRWVREGWIK